ncbi:MAG: hypothetical protein V4754_17990 [Pseudomonadota bacterium]
MNRPRRFHRLACASLGLTLLGWWGGALAKGGAKGVPGYGVSVYSDLCVQAESGDMGGQRLALHRFLEGDSVIYEFTAGALSWPQLAAEVVLEPKAGVLSFTVQGGDERARTVLGTFSADGQRLTLDGAYCADGSIPMVLSKVNDFSRKPGVCKPCPPQKQGAPATQPASQSASQPS